MQPIAEPSPARAAPAAELPAAEPPGRVRYHLDELAAALDPDDRWRSVPDYAEARRVLDIGCGIGQTLIAAPGRAGALRVGIEIDLECLRWGHGNDPTLALVGARAEALPFATDAFDAVSARVSLPYTDVPRALDEIARVLAPGGALWMTLHRADFVRRQWRDALAARRVRDLVFRSYVLLNGLALHLAGRAFVLPGTRRVESFQTESGVRRLLAARGFHTIRTEPTRAGSLLVTARRGTDPLRFGR